jgi:large subunit ribosomal protein L22
MQSTAKLRFSGISARKMRQVADLVRGKDVDVALHSLRFVTKAAARPMEKLITSAVANAREKANAANERFDADTWFVRTVMVDEGPTQNRFRPRAQGRAYRIRKRSCHVNLVLDEHALSAARLRAQAAAAAATPQGGAKRAASKSKDTGKDKGASAAAKSKKPAKSAAAAKPAGKTPKKKTAAK